MDWEWCTLAGQLSIQGNLRAVSLQQTTRLRQEHSTAPDDNTASLTDQAVQSQRFRENQDQNHAHKQLGLLGVGPDGVVRGGGGLHCNERKG